MVYDYGCGVVIRPNYFTNSTKMRFFWLPLLTMNCSSKPLIHIYEWKRHSPSSGSLGLILWILVVAIAALGSRSIIYFPLWFPLLGSYSDSEYAYESRAFSLATSHCLAWYSLMLWVELLWNSHHFHVSFFVFVVLFFSCGLNGLSWVTPPLLCPLFNGLGAPFPWFRFIYLMSYFFCLNLLLILIAYW